MTHTSLFFLQCWVFGMSWGCNAIKAERICTLKPCTLLMSLLKQETRSWWGGAAQASRTERHFVLLCRFQHNFRLFLLCRLMSRALRGALSPADPQAADKASREMSTETSQMRWLLPRVAMPPGIISPSKMPKDLKRPLSTIPTRGQGTQRPEGHIHIDDAGTNVMWQMWQGRYSYSSAPNNLVPGLRVAIQDWKLNGRLLR